MISIFIPIRKGSKRIKNKNFKSLPKFRFGLTELKIRQLEKLKTKWPEPEKFTKKYEELRCKEVKSLIFDKFLKELKV